MTQRPAPGRFAAPKRRVRASLPVTTPLPPVARAEALERRLFLSAASVGGEFPVN